MVSKVLGWIAKIGKAVMDFEVFSLQTPIACTNQVPELRIGALVDRGQRQGCTQQGYLSAGPRAV